MAEAYLQQHHTMEDALWSCLSHKDIMAFKNFKTCLTTLLSLSMLLPPPAPGNPYHSKAKKYTLLNWPCYHEFSEGVALLLLKGGGPFLSSES